MLCVEWVQVLLLLKALSSAQSTVCYLTVPANLRGGRGTCYTPSHTQRVTLTACIQLYLILLTALFKTLVLT